MCVCVCVCVDTHTHTHTQVSQRDFNERLGAIGYSKDPNTVFGDLAYLRAETYEANVRELLSKVFIFVGFTCALTRMKKIICLLIKLFTS